MLYSTFFFVLTVWTFHAYMYINFLTFLTFLFFSLCSYSVEYLWTIFKFVFPFPSWQTNCFQVAQEKASAQKHLGVATLTEDIANYPYLSEASNSTTCHQYSAIKIFRNLYKLTVRRLHVHKIYPAYEITPLDLLDLPLKYFDMSTAIKTLYNYISDHLQLLFNILSTQILMTCGRTDMTTVWNYSVECVKLLRILFHFWLNAVHVKGIERNKNTCTVFAVFLLNVKGVKDILYIMQKIKCSVFQRS